MLDGAPGKYRILQYLEAKPEECIAIEDSFIGIQAAKAANIEVVAYTGAGENQDVSQADYVISSYI
jgi:mannitol-1-/sugar-/sorbitol-6-/2-deoxyglucose-6-phosphatase